MKLQNPGYWQRVLVGLAIMLVVLASAGQAYLMSFRHEREKLEANAQTSAQLKVLLLRSELNNQRSIPMILADDTDIKLAVSQPDKEHFHAISVRLHQLKNETKSAVIYLLDAQAEALASSNWAEPTSFVGNNYHFRDYYKNAITSGFAEQFALGTVSRKPGLFIAHRIGAREKPLGVVTVKVEFDDMEAAWSRAGDQTFVADNDDTILLTSRPEWRFQTIKSPASKEFITRLRVPEEAWHLYVVNSLEPALKAAKFTATLIVLLELLLVGILIGWFRYLKRRTIRAQLDHQYRLALEHNVAQRTEELSQINKQLSREIAERQQAEHKLNVLQGDLVQANKLASLGQIIAGVAHEINQPLATLRIFAENNLTLLDVASFYKMPDTTDQIISNTHSIVRMSERIGHITGELRAFSRKATSETEPILLKATVDSSILLNRFNYQARAISLICEPIDPGLYVMAGRIRLEQVLVNLLQNAAEALEGRENPCVQIHCRVEGDHIVLSVSDNGPGLAADVFAQLFTPFVTTKLKGLGLGLVIAHDIIQDFGGSLTAENSSQGAGFHIQLRKAFYDEH